MSPTLLDKIIAPGGITSFCQPIVIVEGSSVDVVSVELLTRGPANTRFHNPCLMFDYVRRIKAEVIVDKCCIAAGLRASAHLPETLRLGVNVQASTLEQDKNFALFLSETAEQSEIAPSRITVEIVEHSPCWSQPDFLKRLDQLRALGVRIALDDIGTGHSNYRMILDARPDYFKVDSYIVRASHCDSSRQAILRSVLCLSQELGGTVIAEGVEHPAELQTLLQIGIAYIQGYLFCRPVPTSSFTISGVTGVRPNSSLAQIRGNEGVTAIV